MNKKCTKRSGFTLAEILITLGIIGVVAALIIPSLLADHQKTKYITMLTREYSVLQQGIELAKVQHGEIKTWDWTLDENAFYKKYFIPYFNVIRFCESPNAYQCWTDPIVKKYYFNRQPARYYNSPSSVYPTMILNSGASLSLHKYLSGNYFLGDLDTNGNAGPNVYGIDVFMIAFTDSNSTNSFALTSKPGWQLFGENRTREDLYLLCQSGGDYCGALYQADGWHVDKKLKWR